MTTETNQEGRPAGQARNGQTNLRDLQASGEAIIKGARNEDQLDRMREAAKLTARNDTQVPAKNPGGAGDLTPNEPQPGHGGAQTKDG